MKKNSIAIGIDLGTTNSAVAIAIVKPNGEVVSKIIEIPRVVDTYNSHTSDIRLTTKKNLTLPSNVLYMEDKNGNFKIIVGDLAKKQYSLRPEYCSKSIKSQMGNPVVEGLSENILDKTPQQVSARILTYILSQVSKILKQNITDVIITVPANFDSAMCKATIDAAEIAGINVKNDDGSIKNILLSEPNAVIYDLTNQIENGEIPDTVLDLSSRKNVLVFDLGGGTLDITFHEIERRNNKTLKVNEIATNRYTKLGGDNFDELIANFMYKRYINNYIKHPEVIKLLKKEKRPIMTQLCEYAEDLKFRLNEKYNEDYQTSFWDDENDDNETFNIGGNVCGLGYAYDDEFTRDELENILSVFMAKDINFYDYKKIDGVKDTNNIIYPILDVLKKASDKLNIEDINVDAVILNGGMSKFYMVKERIKEFFGFEPIVSLDPDLSVARGAAIYHYYLNRNEELKDDMKKFDYTQQSLIEWGNSILNDSLYLGTKNDSVSMIIPTGSELPYTSNVMIGFRIEPNQNRIEIPIKSKNIDGTYRTISKGNIIFKQKYVDGAYVSFTVKMESNKVITMKAWTSSDFEGVEKIEEGIVEITIDNKDNINYKSKFVPPIGSKLNPKAEINNLLQLCNNLIKANQLDRKNISKRISLIVDSISYCENKSDFAEPILDAILKTRNKEAKMRLFIAGRRICCDWNLKFKNKLAELCIEQLNAELCGIYRSGPDVSTNIQAIYTLGLCGNNRHFKFIEPLKNNPKYYQACLYVYAFNKYSVDWIFNEFKKDVTYVIQNRKSNIQFSSHAIGIALKKDKTALNNVKIEENTIKNLIQVINKGTISNEELTCCILAIGWICDQRNGTSNINSAIITNALRILREIEYIYSPIISLRSEKSSNVAIKMINGEMLDYDEEQFLLTKMEL